MGGNSGNSFGFAFLSKVKQTVINGLSEGKYDDITASLKSALLDKLGATEKAILGAVNQNAANERLILSKIFETLIEQSDDEKQIVKKFAELQNNVEKRNEIIESLSADVKALGCRADELIVKLEGLAGRYEWLVEEKLPRSLLETNEFELNAGLSCLKKADFTGAKWHFGAAIKSTINNLTVKAKGYFGLALAKNKVHLVWDYAYDKCIPICYRKVAFDSDEYENALSALDRVADDTENAELRLAIINFWDRVAEVQNRFETFQKQGYDFDCFICTKISPLPGEKAATIYNNEEKTADWKWIFENQIYAKLKGAGIKTFYSEVDCNKNKYEKGTADYNAYISYALSKAKVMLLVCGKKEYLNTPWVQNEYKRFLSYLKIHKKPGSKIVIIYDGKVVELSGCHYTNYDKSTDFKIIIKRLHEEIEEWANIPNGVVHCQNPSCGNYFRKEENYGECPFCGGELLDTPRVARGLAPAYSETAVTDAAPSDAPAYDNSDFYIVNKIIEMYTGTGDAVVIPGGVKGIKSDAFAGHLFKRVTIPASLGHIGPKAFSECRNLTEIVFKGTCAQWNNIGKGDGWDGGTGAYTVMCLDGKLYKKGLGGALRKYRDKKAEKAEINKVKKNEKEQLKTEKRRKKLLAKLGEQVAKEEAKEEKRSQKSLKDKRRARKYSSDGDVVIYPLLGLAGLSTLLVVEWGCMICDYKLDGFYPRGLIIAVIVTAAILGACLSGAVLIRIIKRDLFDSHKLLWWISVILFVVAGVSLCFMFGLSIVAMQHRDFNLTRPVYIAAVVLYSSALIEAAIACVLLKIHSKSRYDSGWKVGAVVSSVVAGLLLIPMIVMFSITKYKMPEGTTYEEDGIYYSLLADNTFAVYDTESSNYAGPVSIPKYFKGKRVTKISDRAFQGCSKIASISIPDSVTDIGSSAFSDCSSLTNISIPDSVTTIGTYAFTGCNSLQYNDIDNAQYLGNATNKRVVLIKAENTDITSFSVSKETKIIYNGAFEGCSNFTNITIPDSVTSIGFSAFDKCSALTTISIPSGVTSIDAYTFRDCTKLTSINIPDSVTSIGSWAFWNCTNLTGINIPDGVTSIGWGAFCGCSSFTTITIPDGVTSLKTTFYKCTGLTSVKLSENLVNIGEEVFCDCTKLTNITIPDSVTSIGSSAFANCSALTNITIPDSVTDIGSSAFENCNALATIIIPNSVTDIGSGAFAKCSALTTIRIPNSVTNIGSSAFVSCSALTEIAIPEGVTQIGWYAFCGCTKLTSITIPNSVTSIGPSAFAKCSVLTDVTIPDSVTSIGSSAFENCSALIKISIPDSVTSIGSWAFWNCTSLTEIIFKGTEEQWNQITKGTNWDNKTGDYVVKYELSETADN